MFGRGQPLFASVKFVGIMRVFLTYLWCWMASAMAAQERVPFSVEELQRRTFLYFWERADALGQIPDRWPTKAFSSIAATGFGLSAYIVGIERGWVSRPEAAQRVRHTLETLLTLPQGPEVEGMAGYRGFFYHFLDHERGRRHRDVELSSIDSGLLMAGVLSCMSYFDGDDSVEEAIRQLADTLYRRVEWDWMLGPNHRLSMGWRPEKGFLRAEWFGYTEAMILYVLALGSPTHPIPASSWDAWTLNYYWDDFEGQPHVNFGPLFGHQYSHVWVDFRGIQDRYMRQKGMDYFENSRRATLANRAYCLRNPQQFKGYSENTWGLTACDGPMEWVQRYGQGLCRPDTWKSFHAYHARGVASDYLEDDGTIAPTAAGGSVPFAPEVCLPALQAMWETYYDSLVGPYGFKDAFNLTFTADGRLPEGWFAEDYLGIDQGPILLMLENYRSNLLWNVMKKNPYLRTGLRRAGFSGGWLDAFREAPLPPEKPVKPNPEISAEPKWLFERRIFREDKTSALPYRLLRPVNGLPATANYGLRRNAQGHLVDAQGQRVRLPLVVFLHGVGERGYDNERQLLNGVLAFAETAHQRRYPCYVLAPQCPPDARWSGADIRTAVTWSETPTEPMRLLMTLIEQLLRDEPDIDPSRLYLTGLSMGGAGVFDLLMRRPEWFAAAVPLCGGGDPAQAHRIRNVPVWIFHGRQDEVVPPSRSRHIAEALRKHGQPVRYTEYETLAHAIWHQTYYNPSLMAWLFAQRKTPSSSAKKHGRNRRE